MNGCSIEKANGIFNEFNKSFVVVYVLASVKRFLYHLVGSLYLVDTNDGEHWALQLPFTREEYTIFSS